MDNGAYREEHIKYRKLLGMGCDVMLTESQAGEVAKLLGIAHVAMQQNTLLRQEIQHWQDLYDKAASHANRAVKLLEGQLNENNGEGMGSDKELRAIEEEEAGAAQDGQV